MIKVSRDIASDVSYLLTLKNSARSYVENNKGNNRGNNCATADKVVTKCGKLVCLEH